MVVILDKKQKNFIVLKSTVEIISYDIASSSKLHSVSESESSLLLSRRPVEKDKITLKRMCSCYYLPLLLTKILKRQYLD